MIDQVDFHFCCYNLQLHSIYDPFFFSFFIICSAKVAINLPTTSRLLVSSAIFSCSRAIEPRFQATSGFCSGIGVLVFIDTQVLLWTMSQIFSSKLIARIQLFVGKTCLVTKTSKLFPSHYCLFCLFASLWSQECIVLPHHPMFFQNWKTFAHYESRLFRS